MKITKDQENFSSYMDIQVSDESRQLLSEFSKKHPNIKEELFHKTKNVMMATIYNEKQTREYINWVIDTLKFMSKYF